MRVCGNSTQQRIPVHPRIRSGTPPTLGSRCWPPPVGGAPQGSLRQAVLVPTRPPKSVAPPSVYVPHISWVRGVCFRRHRGPNPGACLHLMRPQTPLPLLFPFPFPSSPAASFPPSHPPHNTKSPVPSPILRLALVGAAPSPSTKHRQREAFPFLFFPSLGAASSPGPRPTC